MKVLKIFGIVVGIHLAILIGVFVVPGCTSTTRPAPSAADTVTQSQPAPVITVPNADAPTTPAAAPVPALAADPGGQAYSGFNPDAPATFAGASGGSSTGIRFTPTRPNTAAASAVLAQPVTDVTPAATYSVRSGDSLWTIAKRNHLTVSELAAANGLKTSSVLHQGQKLVIPGKSTPASKSASLASTASAPATVGRAKTAEAAPSAAGRGEKTVTYTVKPGETLGQIARMFDVRSKDIAVANSISDPRNLRAGSVLVIPGGGWQKPAEKAGRSAAAASPAASSAPEAAPTPSTPPNILESDQGQPTPTSSSNVPIIKIDDNSGAPAPKP